MFPINTCVVNFLPQKITQRLAKEILTTTHKYMDVTRCMKKYIFIYFFFFYIYKIFKEDTQLASKASLPCGPL